MLKTANPHHGFYGTIEAKWGQKGAGKAWALAFKAIQEEIPAAEPEQIRNYLDSVYGRHTADSVLDKTSVADQIKNRPARFHRHFASIQRQTADGCFN